MIRILIPLSCLFAFSISCYADEPTANKKKLLKLFASEWVTITPGKGKFPATFEMGSKLDKTEQPVHTVKLSKPFAMAKYEVTQELYNEVIMGTNPSKWKGPRNSVEMVHWNEANDFCNKLTKEMRGFKLLKENEIIRLPTEAEWEYCCRAGTTTPYSFEDAKEINDYGWHSGNSKGEDPPVGAKKPNPWGLYDMHGYLWEWCLDEYHATYEGAPKDAGAWQGEKAKEHVLRSGAWNVPAEKCRSGSRSGKPTSFRSDAVGLRCVKATEK